MSAAVDAKSRIRHAIDAAPDLTAAQVFGEIDIDSDEPAAFGEADRGLVEALAAAIAARLDRSRA